MERRQIERARSGDLDAYDDLVAAYQGLAFRAAYLTLGDAEEAKDVVQEAFVNAYLALDRFDPDAAFRPWLLRIVTNLALNARRTRWRRANLQPRVERVARDESERNLPEDLALAAETRDQLIDALNELSPRDRLLITYRYFLDLSPSEIAEIRETSSSTVRTQIARAIDRLRRTFHESQQSPSTRPTELHGNEP